MVNHTFHWRSELLDQGHIIVTAPTLDQARHRARIYLMAHIMDRFSNLYIDEEDIEVELEIADRDLQIEPNIITALLIEGSE